MTIPDTLFIVQTDMDISVTEPHYHYFVPAFSFDGALIGVCNAGDSDCPVTLTYEEILDRLNSKEWIEK